MANEVDPGWKQFGTHVKRMRDQAGFTQDRVHGMTGISKSMLSAIENSARAPKRSHAELLDKAFSTGGAMVRLWLDIHGSVDVPEWWRDIGAMERNAVEIREYQMTLFPGLIQTSTYARALMLAGRPWDPPEEVERDVESRIARRDQLRDAVFLWFVVDEFALRRRVGNSAVMRDQMTRILDLVAEKRIRFQVIPDGLVDHPGLSGPIRILDFADRSPVVLAEHRMGEDVVTAPRKVRQCRSLFGALQAEALSPSESARMITRIREEYA
ncbi:helix-turn-helix domain-containing protein [Nocardiopsis sediminis]|uniref:Helix-turn-helix domain-containing protein n=1 Tax=Nocardiopsis sediminis TaxID=1778267 RepID=A0ABV8FHI5_9ACTN